MPGGLKCMKKLYFRVRFSSKFKGWFWTPVILRADFGIVRKISEISRNLSETFHTFTSFVQNRWVCTPYMHGHRFCTKLIKLVNFHPDSLKFCMFLLNLESMLLRMTGVKNPPLNPRTLNYTKPTHPPGRN